MEILNQLKVVKGNHIEVENQRNIRNPIEKLKKGGRNKTQHNWLFIKSKIFNFPLKWTMSHLKDIIFIFPKYVKMKKRLKILCHLRPFFLVPTFFIEPYIFVRTI